jgi:hypothetical protein
MALGSTSMFQDVSLVSSPNMARVRVRVDVTA